MADREFQFDAPTFYDFSKPEEVEEVQEETFLGRSHAVPSDIHPLKADHAETVAPKPGYRGQGNFMRPTASFLARTLDNGEYPSAK